MARKHHRQIIREAVVARLKEAGTAAAQRVFSSRLIPYTRTEVPAIGVFALQEPVDPSSSSTAPRELMRKLDLVIEAVVRYTDGVEDALDAICVEIERAMDADPLFGVPDSVSDSILTNTKLGVDPEGAQPVGLAQLTYAVTYYTSAPDAEDVVLDDLKTVDARTSLGGAQAPADQAEDKLENLDAGGA